MKYIIGKETVALIPEPDSFGNIATRVLEKFNEPSIYQEPTKVMMKRNCEFYNSSLEGRKKAAQAIFPTGKMLPICICGFKSLYFIPFSSPDNWNCIWIAHHHVEGTEKAGDHRTIILLSGNQAYEVNLSLKVVEQKVNRAAQYKYIMNKRYGKEL